MKRLLLAMCLTLPAVVAWSAVRTPQNSESASDRYYAVVYSYQDAENHIARSHTFATFVHLKTGLYGDGAASATDTQPASCEHHTISWLPADFSETLKLGFFPQRGRNYSLGETFVFAERLGATVRHWGPYEIDEATYRRALAQIARLERGEVVYRMNASKRFLSDRTALEERNCIRAVNDVLGPTETGVQRGFEAGATIAARFAQREPSRPFRAPLDELVTAIERREHVRASAMSMAPTDRTATGGAE